MESISERMNSTAFSFIKAYFKLRVANLRTGLLLTLCSTLFMGCTKQLEFYELEVKDDLFFERATNSLFTGLAIEYSTKGHVIRKSNFSNGKKNGRELVYWSSGKRKLRVDYVNGKKNGLYQSFHPSGDLKIKVHYEKDTRVGLFEEFYNGGILHTRMHYLDGRRHGPYETFDENGDKLAVGEYIDDKPSGIWTEFDKGHVIRKSNFSNGK